MIREFTISAVLVLATALGLAACSGPSSPTGTAASILSQAGATADGAPYVVNTAEGNGPACDNGSAEADGAFPGGETINVCVLPNTAVFNNDAATAAEADALSKGEDPIPTVEVKSALALIYLTLPTSGRPAVSVQQVAQRVSGIDLG
jgi:hypothetical protein